MTDRKNKALTAICAALILGGISSTASAAWTFSNCAATGSTGPAQGDCDTAYTGTELDGLVTVTGGIQTWTVPASGAYRIDALGAAGGTQTYGGTYSAGGLGASIGGDINLTAGETIYFLIGQRGEDTRVSLDHAAPGGGGGTFVYRSENDAAPLIAAGGGGSGSSCDLPVPANQHASATMDGNDSAGKTNAGSAGNGGLDNVDGPSYWAGAGSGWLTDGTGGDNSTDYDYTSSYGDGGRAPRNSALGGVRHNDGSDEGGDGGFGGGGGGGSDNMGGGGGGGYSGGGGGGGAWLDPAEGCNNAPGGGGGSYNSGANPVDTAASNAGHGQVIVTALDVPTPGSPNPIPTLSVWGLGILAGLLGLMGYRRRVK